MPKNGKFVLGLALAAIVAMVFFPAVVTAVNDSTGTQSVTNETFSANSGTYTDLGGYELDESSVTVYGYNDSSDSYEVASQGTDYELAVENGSVKPLSGSSLIDDGEEVRVTYDYQATGGTTTLLAGFIPVMIGVLIFARLAMGSSKMLGR